LEMCRMYSPCLHMITIEVDSCVGLTAWGVEELNIVGYEL
jgi:hypothetical protein